MTAVTESVMEWGGIPTEAVSQTSFRETPSVKLTSQTILVVLRNSETIETISLVLRNTEKLFRIFTARTEGSDV
jgi:hypothetical protein